MKKLFAALAVTLVLAACEPGEGGPVDAGSAPVAAGRSPQPQPEAPPSGAPTPPIVPEAPVPARYRQVNVYHLTEKDGKLLLIREVHEVVATPRIATAALEELVHESSHRPDHTSPFPRSAQILSVTISDGAATVDWSAEVLDAQVGADAESLGIQAAVWTLTEFPTIRRVRFTVEGRDAGVASNGRRIEDWWGHFGLRGQPWARDTSLRVLREVTS
ncbi:MAG: GerMN domain-containing protein [Actinomycetota bacterium]